MGTREDVMALVEELDELKDYAREHVLRRPNFQKYRRDRCYRSVWRRLRCVEDRIMKEAYRRNIKLKFIHQEVRFREIVDEAPYSATLFKKYLEGQFTELWGNALEEFIILHKKWNKVMQDIVHDNFY
jgi:hypothetical protein